MVPKIVLDTNIIISAFGWKGPPHQILLRCLEGDFQLYLSSALLREISSVLSYPKFGFNRLQIDEFIALIVENAAMVEPDFTLDIVIRRSERQPHPRMCRGRRLPVYRDR